MRPPTATTHPSADNECVYPKQLTFSFRRCPALNKLDIVASGRNVGAVVGVALNSTVVGMVALLSTLSGIRVCSASGVGPGLSVVSCSLFELCWLAASLEEVVMAAITPPTTTTIVKRREINTPFLVILAQKQKLLFFSNAVHKSRNLFHFPMLGTLGGNEWCSASVGHGQRVRKQDLVESDGIALFRSYHYLQKW